MQDKEYRIFVGNPGTGKSTLLNGLFQQIKFKSGLSFGTGLTTHLQLEKFNDNLYYGDTPGLNDIDTRQKAAEEIGKALKKNGVYKIFFVITLEAGRVRPADATTINLVLKAIDVKVPFAVIINKLSPNAFTLLKENKNQELAKIAGGLFGTGRVTRYIYLMKQDQLLLDATNVIPPRDENFGRFEDFVEMVPFIEVKPEQVHKIKSSEFEEMEEEMRKQIDALHQNKQFLEQTVMKMKQDAQKEAEEFKRAMIETEERNKKNLEVLENSRREEMRAIQQAQEKKDREMEARYQNQIQSLEKSRRELEQRIGSTKKWSWSRIVAAGLSLGLSEVVNYLDAQQ